jgi:hypothetical protein
LARNGASKRGRPLNPVTNRSKSSSQPAPVPKCAIGTSGRRLRRFVLGTPCQASAARAIGHGQECWNATLSCRQEVESGESRFVLVSFTVCRRHRLFQKWRGASRDSDCVPYCIVIPSRVLYPVHVVNTWVTLVSSSLFINMNQPQPGGVMAGETQPRNQKWPRRCQGVHWRPPGAYECQPRSGRYKVPDPTLTP